MTDIAMLTALELALVLVLGSLTLLARNARRRGVAGRAFAAAMAADDEGFHGTALDAFVEVAAAEERAERPPVLGSGEGLCA
ncbi:hypothetical protein V6N00_09075 [Tersicoccus sp. MR15.9]|uniref:hypothetical protein n=1 Tax=Tersicoccus mangrovi TaxID=3121635 RepID=UPI002FE654A8